MPDPIAVALAAALVLAVTLLFPILFDEGERTGQHRQTTPPPSPAVEGEVIRAVVKPKVRHPFDPLDHRTTLAEVEQFLEDLAIQLPKRVPGAALVEDTRELEPVA